MAQMTLTRQKERIEELKIEITEYEEMIDDLSAQLCGDENDEEFEKEIGYYEMIIENNKNLIKHLTLITESVTL